MQVGRSYRYTTASPPAIACALQASLRLIASADDRRAVLAAHRARLQRSLLHARWPLMPSDTAIQPLRVGTNADALALAAQLRRRGLWVPAIRPPTVPAGSARLRISLTAAHEAAQVERLCEAVIEAGYD
jgi:8-amino-7-oxononanoate synthase